VASFFVSESGQLLEAAKRAALDAVAGYSNVTPYTIGIAVQAAAGVLQAGARAGIREHVGATHVAPEPIAGSGPVAIDVQSVEVTPRLRALESVARAAVAMHRPHDVEATCVLCEALVHLEDLEAAG
jgi:hypothetical protein